MKLLRDPFTKKDIEHKLGNWNEFSVRQLMFIIHDLMERIEVLESKDKDVAK